ncbi:MFS transporter [Streptomyces sp. NPDC093510]|uniref:MFS transporter n=1 Tax=Streptomyces sp. NPDC093510 TaxID=3155199 RepID=UPI00341EF113
MIDLHSAAGPGKKPSAPGGGLVLGVLLSAMFIVQFDFFVVNVAAPSLESDLDASAGMLELVVGGYAFAFASGMITGGRLGDIYGHRRLFVIGMTAFGLSSLLCGITATPGQLVAARLVQGAAGALMVPQVLAVITAHFPAAAKPRALAGYGMASGLGSIAGQVLGGGLLELHLFVPGWRLIFLINVPVCAVAAVLAARHLPAPASAPGPRGNVGLDPAGAAGVSLALVLVLLPLSLGRTEGWPAWSWICLGAALPVAVGTLLWERALTRGPGSPVLDLTLFRSSSFSSGMIAGIAFQLYFGSFMFTLTMLLQSGLDLGPLGAGLVFAPMGVLFAGSSLLGRRLADRFGAKVLIAGSAVTGAGLLLLAVLLHHSGQDVGVPLVVACLCLVGFGNGLVLPALIGAALVKVRPEKAGAASGVLTTTQQFASSAGVALVGATFFALLGEKPSAPDYARAMTSSALIDLVLVVAVMCMCWVIKRIAESVRH